MIVDVTGTILVPGNRGRDCPGNGRHEGIACCCDECDYMLCCIDDHSEKQCPVCKDAHCPRMVKK